MGGSSNWVPIGSSGKGTGSSSSSWVPMGTGGGGHHGGGGGAFGWLGSAGHWLGQKAGLAGHDIAQIPAGSYHLLKPLPTAVYDLGRYGPLDAWGGKKGAAAENAVTQDAYRQTTGLVKSTAQTLKHPLRDPFATGLTVAPALSGLGRLGEAGVAAGEAGRAGEGALAAARAAGKSLLTKEGQPFRQLHVGENKSPVTLIGSRNPAVRFAQRGYDRMVQKALDRQAAGVPTGRVVNRVALHGMKRVQGALLEEQRLGQRMRAVPATQLDTAAAKLSHLPGKAGRAEHQAALELTSVQTPAEEAAVYHYRQAAKGVNPAQNTQVAKLYERVAKRNLVHVDETRPAGAKVFINPAETKLARADAALAKVQKRGDSILAEHGVMAREQLQGRVDAPARIRAGATYEKPTAAKHGIASAKLVAARAEHDRLASLHEKALLQEERWIAKPRPAATREMTDAEAKARLAELDKFHQVLIDKAIPYSSPFTKERGASGRMYDKEQLRRNYVSGKTGRRQLTVKEEEAQLAEEKLREAAVKYKGQPWADSLAAHLAERDLLSHLVGRRQEAPIFGHDAPALPQVGAGPATGLPPGSNPYRDRIVQTGIAKELAAERVAKLEARAAKRVKPTGIVGGRGARPGRGYLGYKSTDKALTQAERPTASRSLITGVRKEPVDAKSKTFTGRNIETGLVPKDVTGRAAGRYRQILKFENTDRLRREALKTASPVKRSNRDVLIREPDVSPADLTAEDRIALGQERRAYATPDELAKQTEHAATEEGLRARYEMLRQRMLDQAESSQNETIGAEAPRGYKWVDKAVIRKLTEEPRPAGGPGAKIGRAVDNVNSAVTAMTVYFKVGHVGTRVLTNAATNLMQGSLRPDLIARSGELWHSLSDTEKERMLAAAGQHGFSALPHEGVSKVARFAGWGAKQWARHADAPFRFNSLAYELRKAGYTTRPQVLDALNALEHHGDGLPANEWSKISTAARRADREAISYDRLNDFERRFLTRGLWFYPWIKGSTLFTVRSMLEHPVKMGFAGQAGVQGRQLQERLLGDVPSYEQGLVDLGGKGGFPLTTDLSTFSPFATGGDVLQAPAEPGALSGFFNPVLGAAGQLAYGINQYGSASKTPYTDALLALGSPTPEQQLAEALAQPRSGQDHMFAKTPWSVALRYLLGPATPRRVNRSKLNEAAARERSGQR